MFCQMLSQVGETLLKVIVDDLEDETQFSGLTKEQLAKPELVDYQVDKHKSGGVLSTPPIRNLAKQYGIDINDVRGTGVDGRVLKEDILQYAVEKGILEEQSVCPAASPREQLGGSENYPHTPDEVRWSYEDKKVQLRYKFGVRYL